MAAKVIAVAVEIVSNCPLPIYPYVIDKWEAAVLEKI